MQITYAIAMAAGRDAGNRNAILNGRAAWDEDDFNIAATVTSELLAVVSGHALIASRQDYLRTVSV